MNLTTLAMKDQLKLA